MSDIWHRLQVIIQARKPEFFNYPSMSLFEIVTQDGLMRPCFNARKVLTWPADAAVYMCHTLLCSGVTLAAAIAALLIHLDVNTPQGGLYCGGSAKMVEKALGVEGDDILYVGDHIYTDAGRVAAMLLCSMSAAAWPCL